MDSSKNLEAFLEDLLAGKESLQHHYLSVSDGRSVSRLVGWLAGRLVTTTCTRVSQYLFEYSNDSKCSLFPTINMNSAINWYKLIVNEGWSEKY